MKPNLETLAWTVFQWVPLFEQHTKYAKKIARARECMYAGRFLFAPVRLPFKITAMGEVSPFVHSVILVAWMFGAAAKIREYEFSNRRLCKL